MKFTEEKLEKINEWYGKIEKDNGVEMGDEGVMNIGLESVLGQKIIQGQIQFENWWNQIQGEKYFARTFGNDKKLGGSCRGK